MGYHDWSGQVVRDARVLMARRLPAPCGVCGRMVTAADTWHVGHIRSRATHPELTRDKNNWRIEHASCSNASSQSVVKDKAARDALRRAGIDPDSVFSIEADAAQPPNLSTNLPRRQGEALDLPERLLWNVEALSQYDWLLPILAVPQDASPPLLMTRPHPDAVGSFGAKAIAWIEKTERVTLRWWQRLAIMRQLEHDADQNFTWRTIVESGPRRIGKSVRLRGMALWRLEAEEHGLFGETQLVVHTGKDVAIVREIQKKAWRWAEEVAGWKVARANGKEAIETPNGGRWFARSQHAVYGYDVTLGMVDEAWSVEPGAVDEGLEPATMERINPQLHLTSTAHRRATSLMRKRIGNAIDADDGETLLLLWAAPPGSDPGDPETWRKASAHYSEDRRKMIAAKYEGALSGEEDPEADDPDPMAGFKAQYLNMWTLKQPKNVVGSPIVTEDDWRGLIAPPPDSPSQAAAVEGWPGEGLSIARAWSVDDVVVVSVEDVPDVATAAALLRDTKARVFVGASLADDPAWAGIRVVSRKGTTKDAAVDIQRMLNEGLLRHDGGEHLTEQILSLHVSPGSDGIRVRSVGRADALKTVVWAATNARKKPRLKPEFIFV